MSNVKCNRVMALVKRDMAESIPVIVFAHELDILRAIHGEAKIEIVDDPERVVAQSTEGLTPDQRSDQIAAMLSPAAINGDDEYHRLSDRYGMHAEVSVPNVEYVYGRPNSDSWRSALRRSGEDVQEEAEEAPRVKRAYTKRADKSEGATA